MMLHRAFRIRNDKNSKSNFLHDYTFYQIKVGSLLITKRIDTASNNQRWIRIIQEKEALELLNISLF